MEIGQQVKVRGINERIPAKIVNQLKQNRVGKIVGYKMVDGSGVGYIVEFANSMSTWFFENELEPVS
ncbi:MAG: DUF2862 domain-containing protein [Cyanobacteriota bacterium]|nr:DUF2862 domain-containing protein [Cyanobacteriota bacterium]